MLLLYLLPVPAVHGIQNPKGAIQGVVLRGNTDLPAAGVHVAIYAAAENVVDKPIQTTATDGSGTFRLTGLAPGGYSIRFSREGYADSYLGERHNNHGLFVRIVDVAAGQTTQDIVMRLAPTGSVSGTVRDVRGMPVVGIPVRLSRSVFGDDGTKEFQSSGMATSDDRGEYRIFGIESGRYYVSAGANPLRVIKGNESVEPFAISYYPGADDLANARAIELEPGGNVERIDFTLRMPKFYRVRGRIIDGATNMPPLSPGIATNTGTWNLNQKSYDPKTGNFEIDGLAPGEFKVSAWIRGSQCGVPFMPDELFTTNAYGIPSYAGASGSTSVRLGDGDLENVMVVIRHGGCLKGNVTTEGKPLPHWFPLELRNEDEKEIRISILIQNDGQFKVDGLLPGKYRLIPQRLPEGFYLKAAAYGEADILKAPLEFDAEGSKELQILLSSKVAHAEGRVTTASGKPMAGVLVALVPEGLRTRYDLYVTTDTNEDGKFILDDLAPGDYSAFAWESLEENSWMNADVIARYQQYGQPVHLAEDSKEILNLTVIPENLLK
jgi:5-hydroxyisourate hydrolase-like protein (transthyretin family)